MSVKSTLLHGATASINQAIDALEQLKESDTYDYEAEGKVSAVQLCIAQLGMVRDDVGRMINIQRGIDNHPGGMVV